MEYEDNPKRPKVSRPRLESWRSTDDEISMLLEDIDNRVLNIDEQELQLEGEEKTVTYKELSHKIEKISISNVPDYDTVLKIKKVFLNLPNKFKEIKTELYSILKRFTLNTQEQLNVIDEFENYCDQLEEENKELKERIANINEKETDPKKDNEEPIETKEIKQEIEKEEEKQPKETKEKSEVTEIKENDEEDIDDDISKAIAGG